MQGAALSVNFLGTNVEKMKAQLLARSWERMSEAAERCLVIEPDCLEGQAYLVLFTLAAEGKYPEVPHPSHPPTLSHPCTSSYRPRRPPKLGTSSKRWTDWSPKTTASTSPLLSSFPAWSAIWLAFCFSRTHIHPQSLKSGGKLSVVQQTKIMVDRAIAAHRSGEALVSQLRVP